MISHGSIASSRSGTRSSRTSMPAPSRAISASADASPAAPQSCSDSTRPPSTSSSDASINVLPVKGSPIWTAGRSSESSSPSSCDASTDAPPMPPPAVVAEAQSIQNRDRPCAHRDDVPEDPPDAGRGALERLDGRRMVVRLDLERDRLPLAEINHAGVLTWTLQNTFPVGGKPFQQEGRVLVAAVLRPEQGENRELEVVRATVEQTVDAVELLVGQPQRTVERLFRRDLRQVSECSGETR